MRNKNTSAGTRFARNLTCGMQDSLKIDGEMWDEKVRIAALTRRDQEKPSDWGRMAG